MESDLAQVAWAEVSVGSMELRAATQAFLLQLQADGRSPHTVGQYRRHVSALADWLASTGARTDVAYLSPDLLARFFAGGAARDSCWGGAKKATSLNSMRTSIRCFCGFLHDAGLVAANAARLLRRARCTPPPPKALHADEQQRLLDVLAAAEGPEARRDEMLVRLLLGCGLRIGSALALDVADLDFEHGEITVRRAKNDRPSTFVMPKSLGQQLQRFVAERSGPVFLANGARISTRHAQRRITTWFSAAGIRGRSAHALRHTFATRIYQGTGDLQLTQQALGHASISSTVVYARLDRERLRAAVGA